MFYLRQAGRGRIAPEVPERAEDFADRETEYTLALLEEDGDPVESLAGTIRFTVDTLEVFPNRK